MCPIKDILYKMRSECICLENLLIEIENIIFLHTIPNLLD